MKLPKYRPAKPTQPVGILTNCITYGTNALNIYPKSYPARQSGRNDFAFGVKEMYICNPIEGQKRENRQKLMPTNNKSF